MSATFVPGLPFALTSPREGAMEDTPVDQACKRGRGNPLASQIR